MNIGTNLPHALLSHDITERKSDFNTQIESLEQKKEKLAKQLQQMQNEQKGGETDSAQQQNLQRQIDNINKRISLLADRSNQNVSATKEQKQPVEHNDQFIKSEEQSQRSPGIYDVKKDGEGGTAVSFNRPNGETGNALRDETGTAQPDSTAKRETDETMDADESQKALHPDQDEKQTAGRPTSGKRGTIATVNTDRIEAEIRKLKSEKQQIERELNLADNESKRTELGKRLQSIESKIRLMDTDAYKKQHAEYSFRSVESEN